MNYYISLFRFNHEDCYVLFKVDVREWELLRLRYNMTMDEIFLHCFKEEVYPTWERPFILFHSQKVSEQFVEKFEHLYNVVTISEEYLP